jgi:nuclear pore complex protein Nup43
MSVLSVKNAEPIRVFEDADSCSMTSVNFIKHDEVSDERTLGRDGCNNNYSQVIVSNMRGQLNLFDLRKQETKPTATFMSIGNEHVSSTACVDRHAEDVVPDQVGVICTARHPTQAHIVCSGAQDGSLTFWDLRCQGKSAMTVLKGHEQAVNEASTARA